jgi:hypothetical protein
MVYSQKLGITLWKDHFQRAQKTVISGIAESLHKKYTTKNNNKNNAMQ